MRVRAHRPSAADGVERTHPKQRRQLSHHEIDDRTHAAAAAYFAGYGQPRRYKTKKSRLLASVLFFRLRAGKSLQWLGDPDAIQTFSFTLAIGRALAALAKIRGAFGQAWRLPTARDIGVEAVTGRAPSRLACSAQTGPVGGELQGGWPGLAGPFRHQRF